jgi:hypothetical protein
LKKFDADGAAGREFEAGYEIRNLAPLTLLQKTGAIPEARQRARGQRQLAAQIFAKFPQPAKHLRPERGRNRGVRFIYKNRASGDWMELAQRSRVVHGQCLKKLNSGGDNDGLIPTRGQTTNLVSGEIHADFLTH